MTSEKEFTFDVAFSFVKEDEELATRLNELLRGRLRTFIYSDHQERLGGRDGEQVFNSVFGEEARIVVILYRPTWGTTAWTRIEETAIRNRGFEEGYDFVILIPTTTPVTPPKWLPKNRIWIGLDRWGIEAAAGVIESRVQEAGGTPSEETVEDRASRLAREIDAEQKRKGFLSSDEGVRAALKSLNDLATEIQRICDAATDAQSEITFRVEHDERNCAIYSHDHTVYIHLSLQWANTLDQSGLYVTLWRGAVTIRGARISGFEDPKELKRFEFDVDYQVSTQNVGWRLNRKGSPFLTTRQLAEFCVDMLLEKIRTSRLPKR